MRLFFGVVVLALSFNASGQSTASDCGLTYPSSPFSGSFVDQGFAYEACTTAVAPVNGAFSSFQGVAPTTWSCVVSGAAYRLSRTATQSFLAKSGLATPHCDPLPNSAISTPGTYPWTFSFPAQLTCATRPIVGDEWDISLGGSVCDSGCKMEWSIVVGGDSTSSVQWSPTGAVCGGSDGVPLPQPKPIPDPDPPPPDPDPTPVPVNPVPDPAPPDDPPPLPGDDDGDGGCDVGEQCSLPVTGETVSRSVESVRVAVEAARIEAARNAQGIASAIKGASLDSGSKLDSIKKAIDDAATKVAESAGKGGGDCSEGANPAGCSDEAAKAVRDLHKDFKGVGGSVTSLQPDVDASIAWGVDDASSVGMSALNSAGLGWGSSCPSLPSFSLAGYTVDFQPDSWCSLLGALAQIILAAAYVQAAYIIGRGG